MEEIEYILKCMMFGNWDEAQTKYKQLKISARDFDYILDELTKEQIRDLALLGFYTK